VGPEPRIVFGAHDRAYMVWASPNGVDLVVAHGGRRFGAPDVISGAGATLTSPSIALTPDGNAVIARCWLGSRLSDTGGIAVTDRDPAGALSRPVKLPLAPNSENNSGTAAGRPDILIDPKGQALIDWQQGDFQIEEAVRAPDGTIGPTSIIGNNIVGAEPLIMDAHGDTIVSYEAGPDQETFWQLRPPGGTFGGWTPIPDSVNGYSFLMLRAERRHHRLEHADRHRTRRHQSQRPVTGSRHGALPGLITVLLAGSASSRRVEALGA
jgi:hypothetical protein